jgi:transcriptional regulator with XRE-family HTH domain
MTTIGNKICETRKRKGFTQEELADFAKINLRTLQRIENGETEPRSHTLKSLCKTLEINLEDILDAGKIEDLNFLTYFHLSVIAAILIPLGNIILPLILWVTKKDKIVSLREQGINLINFQLNWTILLSLFLLSVRFHWIPFLGNRLGYIEYALISLIIVNIIYPILISILINNRGVKRYYPTLIRFIK